jgi:hypothetical protein
VGKYALHIFLGYVVQIICQKMSHTITASFKVQIFGTCIYKIKYDETIIYSEVCYLFGCDVLQYFFFFGVLTMQLVRD